MEKSSNRTNTPLRTRLRPRWPQAVFVASALAALVACSPASNQGSPTGGMVVLGEDGSVIGVVGADGTVIGADGMVVGTVGTDGMVVGTDGMVVGAVGSAGTGAGGTATAGSPGAAGTSMGGATPVASGLAEWINSQGKAPTNELGIAGYWYAFGDGATSTQSGNPFRDGKYCVAGEANGDAANWGAGIGLDLNAPASDKLAYSYEGRVSGFRMTLEGSMPAGARVQFVTTTEGGVSPFIDAVIGESFVYSIADAVVPLTWDVENAGERPAGTLYSLQILAPGDSAAGPIDLCISEFEPVFEETGPAPMNGPYINSDSYILAENNTFGIQGGVYRISDGNSTTEVGSTFRDGKYCVAGTFSGAADDWGAGIAFDLNAAPGGSAKAPLAWSGAVAGFRIGLSGTTPGLVRVQYVINEPQDGNQPFLVGRMNRSTNYPIAWAQVPTSWDVADSGTAVGDAIYTLQVYVDGTEPGPFDVCVEEFLPLTAAEVAESAQTASAGYNGTRSIEAAELEAEYAVWKSRHFSSCGDGTACVPRDEGDCISEGVAYGMLISVGFDDQAAFDQLWAYYEKHKNGNGVMNWQTSECGSVTSSGSATDGELDAAMALIQASCKWGGTYEAAARELLQAILTSEVTNCSGRTILKPGDNFGGCDRTNPSYFAPGYYKVFQELTGDATWTTLANDSYDLLATLQGGMNGLVPDWTNSTGAVPSGADGEYGPDASRTPWRIATDYAWYADPRATTFLDNVVSYIDSSGGISRTFTPNSNYRGALALSSIHQGATAFGDATNEWLTTVVDDNTYFPGTLRPIYMLLAANQFPAGCN